MVKERCKYNLQLTFYNRANSISREVGVDKARKQRNIKNNTEEEWEEVV